MMPIMDIDFEKMFIDNGWSVDKDLDTILEAMKTVKSAVNFAINNRNRWIELEPFILTDIDQALRYASRFNIKRWTELENILIEHGDPVYLSQYAHSIMHERWPEVEDIILTDVKAAASYASKLDYKWLALECKLTQDVKSLVDYITYVIKGRMPEYEELIAKDSVAAFKYAQKVIEDKWDEAEATISGDVELEKEYKAFKKDCAHRNAVRLIKSGRRTRKKRTWP